MLSRSPIRKFAAPLLLLALTATSFPARAQGFSESGFQSYLQLVSAKARSEGVSDATIARVTRGLTINPRVVELDRGQPGGNTSASPPIAPYLRRHVDSARINGGRAMRNENATIIARIERQYGVPGKVLLAIWGHETNYGSYTGDFDLARSLATLAYEGRRRALFEREFISLMKMVDRGVPREKLYGSWAGAFGNPQFLPSVYLRVAADGDGDGDRDIWSSRADTFASIANYFRDAGWRTGEPWGVRASVPGGFNSSSVATRLNSPSCPRVHARHSRWKTVAEWRRLGITPLAPIADRTMATFFQPDGPGTPAYLLTGNYRVILQYNCSNFYAMSVGLLADEIAR
jgi:membrane-bound lytic murein transglycosylase B